MGLRGIRNIQALSTSYRASMTSTLFKIIGDPKTMMMMMMMMMMMIRHPGGVG